jgi:2'-5' RNA ligase
MPAGEEEGGTVRAFVALDLDAVSLRRVADLAEALRTAQAAPSARWTPPDNMHVTLAFAGALRSDAVVPLANGLRPLARSTPTPTSHGSWLDGFPSTAKAGVVVLRLRDENGALATLAEKVADLPSLRTFAKADRAFRPHVTLARLRQPSDVRHWLRSQPGTNVDGCRMPGLTLYRSLLGARGSTYVALERFDFSD